MGVPYGYRIEDGRAVVYEEEASVLRQVFRMYLEGVPLRLIGPKLGIGKYHQGIAHLLENRTYLGTDFYPQVIDRDLFFEVQKARADSRKRYARSMRGGKKPVVYTQFVMEPASRSYGDAYEQAQTVYSRIKAGPRQQQRSSMA